MQGWTVAPKCPELVTMLPYLAEGLGGCGYVKDLEMEDGRVGPGGK